MLRIYSVSLGCPKNRVDTERTLGSLGPYQLVPTPLEADLVFINTCGFIQPAVQESVRTILEHIADVAEQKEKPFIAVAGCLVGRYGETALAPDLPEVDLWLDNRDLHAWAEQLTHHMHLPITAPGRLVTPANYAWLKISDGCRHNCSFCTIPSIRGKLQNLPQEIIVQEATMLLQHGIKELILVAQDVTAWNNGTEPHLGLIPLLEDLLPLTGLERLRLMYLYPAGLTESLLSFLQQAGKPFIPYFDIPLQHASADVLRRMGRPFAHNPWQTIKKIRHYFPEAALRTSIITGFPGETDKDFDSLCEFVTEARFHNLGVFTYQPEDGTPAATFPDQIEDRVKEWRRDTLMEIQGEISEEILAGYLGQRMDIFVDAPHPEWPGLYTGRSWFQAPEIDGITYVSGPAVQEGNIVTAEIVETTTYDLVALTDADSSAADSFTPKTARNRS